MRKPTTGLLLLGAAIATLAITAACGSEGSGDSGGGAGDDSGGESLSQLTTGNPQESAVSSYALRDTKGQSTGSPAGGPQPPATGSNITTTGGGLPLPTGDAASLERKIIFTANLALSADDVSTSFNEVGRIARSAGGFIEKSSLAQRKTGDDGQERQYGSLTIRVPSGAYQDVLASLRTLPGAKLDREDSGSNEVTEEYADLQSRLRNLERSEAQYLRLLEQAKTIQEIITVNERVDGIRAQIEQVQGRLKLYDDLTDLATISVSLSPIIPGKVEPKPDNGPKSFSESFADAWEWSLDAARSVTAASAVVVVGAIWLLIPAVAAVAGLRLAGRRRGGQAA
ncbi:MAG: DUF4349 domain-containing protein [Chloroflexi bacterium]|nr:DUF4349 domain-containing protein [Chloroflexota bacterium]